MSVLDELDASVKDAPPPVVATPEPTEQPKQKSVLDDLDASLEQQKDPIKTTAMLAEDVKPKEAEAKIVRPTPKQDLSNLAQDAPATHKAMTIDGDHHAAIEPHVEELTKHEKILRNKASLDKVTKIGMATTDGLKGAIVSGVGYTIAGVAALTDMVANSYEEPELGPSKKSDELNLFSSVAEATKKATQYVNPYEEKDYAEINKLSKKGDHQGAAELIASKLGSGVGGVGVFMLAPEKAFTSILGAQSLGQSMAGYESDVKAGLSKGKAGVKGVMDGMFSFGLGMLGTRNFIKGMNGRLVDELGLPAAESIWRHLAKQIGLMAGMNLGGEIEQRFSKWVTGAKGAWNDFESAAPWSVALGAASGLVLAGGHNLLSEKPIISERPDVVDKIKKNLEKTQIDTTKKQFKDTIERYTNLDLHEQIKDPIFRDSLKNNGMDRTYIPVDAFEQYAASIGVEPSVAAAELGLTDAHASAKEHGGVMAVDTLDLMKKLSGSQHISAFSDMVKFDPEHKTGYDAKVDKMETTEEDKSEREARLEKQLEEHRAKIETLSWDKTTGLRKEDAFEHDETFFKPGHHTGSLIDLDNMAQLNYHLSHGGTNQLLRVLGDKLTQIEKETGGKIKFARMHAAGDEIGASIEPGFEDSANKILTELQRWADEQKIIVHNEHGEAIESKGPTFSFGLVHPGETGRSFNEAVNKTHSRLVEDKDERTKSSKRAKWDKDANTASYANGATEPFRKITNPSDIRGQNGVPGESGNRYVDIARGSGEPEPTPSDGANAGIRSEDQRLNERVEEKLKPYQPLLDKILGAGIYGKKAERWNELIRSTVDKVRKEISDRIIAAKERRQSREWKSEHKDIKAEEAKTYDAVPAVQAKAILETGKMPDGSRLPDAIKDLTFKKGPVLDNAHQLYRFEDTDELNQLARYLGFDTTSEMLGKATNLDEREDHLNDVADAVMQQRHGQPEAVADDQLIDLVLHDQLAKVAREEAKYIASKAFRDFIGMLKEITGKPRTTEEIHQQANTTLDGMAVRDISSKDFDRLAEKHNKEAVGHMAAGRWQELFDSREKEALNHELYKQAVEREKEKKQIEDLTRKSGTKATRDKMAKSGHDDLAQFDALRNKFNLPGGKKQEPQTSSLPDWIVEQEKNGYPPQISNTLTTHDKMDYKDMKSSDFRELGEALKQIKEASDNRNKVRMKNEVVEMANLEDMLSASLRYHFPQLFDENGRLIENAYDLHPGLIKELHGKLEEFKNKRLLRPEYAMNALDGHKMLGEFWRALFQPIAEGENTKGNLRDMFERDMAAAFKKAGISQRAFAISRVKRIHVPELETKKLKGNMTMENLLATLGHLGNEGNIKTFCDGNACTEQNMIDAVQNHLKSEHVQLVQDMIDHLSKYKDIYDKIFQEEYGYKPKWVEGKPRELKMSDGKTVQFRGGYWPIEFDGDRSARAKQLEQMKDIGDALGGFPGATATSKGHLLARVGSGGRAPIMDFSAIENHVRKVHTDIALGQAVRDVYKKINNPEIAKMMSSVLGKGGWETFNPWLRDIATQKRGFDRGFTDMAADWAIGGLNAVNIGWRTTSALVHSLSLVPAAEEIGYKNLAKAHAEFGKNFVDRIGAYLMAHEEGWDQLGPEHADFFKNPYEVDSMAQQVDELSDYMKYVRRNGIDNSIASFTKELGKNWGKRGFFGDIKAIVGAHGYDDFIASLPALVKSVDMANSYPIWWASYNRALRGEVDTINKASADYMSAEDLKRDAVLYADSMVRETKGAGNLSDLTAMQRGNVLDRIFTVFYNPINAQLNSFMRATGRMDQAQKLLPPGKEKNAATVKYMRYIMTSVIGVAIAQQYMRGHGPDSKESGSIGGSILWGLKAIAKYPMEWVPYLRDLEHTMETGKYGGPSVIQAASSVVSGAVAAKQSATQHKQMTKQQFENMVYGTGYLFHLPAGEAYKFGEEFKDWSTGRYRPGNVEMPFGMGKIPNSEGAEGAYEMLTSGEKKR